MKISGNVVVFWTVPEETAFKWIAQELEHGRLRQGWGPAGSQLVEASITVPQYQWVERAREFSKQWPEEYHEGWWNTRYRIMKRLLEIRVGDLIIIPSIPQGPEFTIAVIDCPYQFDIETGYATYPRNWHKDFGHVIGVDQTKQVALDRNMSRDAALVASKFQNYRSAVNIVRQPDYAAAVARLFNEHAQ